MFHHAKNHKQEKLNCVYNTELSCQIGRSVASIDEILHNLIFHIDEIEILQAFQNLLTCDEECSKTPGKKNKVIGDNGHKQVVNDNMQGSYGSNGTDIRANGGEKDDVGLSGTNHMETFACKN